MPRTVEQFLSNPITIAIEVHPESLHRLVRIALPAAIELLDERADHETRRAAAGLHTAADADSMRMTANDHRRAAGTLHALLRSIETGKIQ